MAKKKKTSKKGAAKRRSPIAHEGDPIIPDWSEFWSSCKLLTARFGFRSLPARNPEEFEFAVKGALHRFDKQRGSKFSGRADIPAALREFVKVLAGAVYATDIRKALTKVDKDRHKELFEAVSEQLMPEVPLAGSKDPGRFYDPLSWDLDSVSVETATERKLRLSLFVSAMLCQEDGLKRAKVSSKATGRAIARVRNRRGELAPRAI